MTRFALTFGLGVVAAVSILCGSVQAQHPAMQYSTQLHHNYLQSHTGGAAAYTHAWNQYRAAQSPWHGDYYHTAYGRPVALVVPPNADTQTHWSWGAPSTRITPIYHQFGRAYPGPISTAGRRFRSTPQWPSSTDQFGVYYVRAPW